MCLRQVGAFPPVEEYVEKPKAIRREARECHIIHATVGLAIATDTPQSVHRLASGTHRHWDWPMARLRQPESWKRRDA
jgi:hypothetical protein